MTYQILLGNNLDILPTLEDNSVDSIVTDPPYELGFMGKKWDSSGIAYSVELWQQCLRVLKPGGHLLSFGGTRTYHRMAVAIEDAGFDIRDSIAWLYGSGFPKSLNLKDDWQGWGTALKPSFEPVVVARKPIKENTVAANVLAYRTGALNIDASRIKANGDNLEGGKKGGTDNEIYSKGLGDSSGRSQALDGRWPANLILDEYTADLLDEQSGQTASKAANRGLQVSGQAGGLAGSNPNYKDGTDSVRGHNDSGGASRFFYVAKASKRDRNEGLEDLPEKIKPYGGREIEDVPEEGDRPGSVNDKFTTQPAKNFHPTVKPTELMRYLVKLITPPGGIVLDPFTGSGSTGKAAILEGFDFIGIELTEDYWPIIEGRLRHAEAKVAERIKETSDQEQEKLF